MLKLKAKTNVLWSVNPLVEFKEGEIVELDTNYDGLENLFELLSEPKAEPEPQQEPEPLAEPEPVIKKTRTKKASVSEEV